MSAELLRRAAETLRTSAEKADHSQPWCADVAYGAIRHVRRNVDRESYAEPCEHEGECGLFGMYDGPYVALMHPPVALALADHLEAIAPLFDGLADDGVDDGHEAIRLARAILREVADVRP